MPDKTASSLGLPQDEAMPLAKWAPLFGSALIILTMNAAARRGFDMAEWIS